MPSLSEVRKSKFLFLFSTLVLLLSVVTGVALVQRQKELRTKAAGNPYYIATNGSDSNPGTLSQPWKTIGKANQTLQAGDTVLIKGGTYKETIQPAKSGTSSNRITYRNYGNETVIISGINEPLILSGRSYITIRGLEFRNVGTFLTMANGDYNNIEYNTFADSTYWRWTGMLIESGSTHNWFHHNKISGHGDYIGIEDRGDIIQLRTSSDYNLFEDNEIFHGGHSPFSVGTSFNVIRNNYFHNEVWKKGFGNRDMDVGYGGQNLLEGNRFGFSALPNDVNYADGIQMSAPGNIVRYNLFYENMGNGLKLTAYYSQTTGSLTSADNNHVYNNVFYHNGVNVSPTVDPGAANRAGLKYNAHGVSIKNTAVKNNIFYKNLGGTIALGSTLRADQTILNNWESGDPRFVNESNAGPSNPNLPDFHLQSGSGAINAGIHLTETASSGSGTSVNVKDALYFSDGFGIVDADWIKIGSASPVQITNVNYATNTITLKEARSWSANAPVWLYKDSRGNVVFLGNAPDIGAFESGSATPPPQTPIPTKTPTPVSLPGDIDSDGDVDIFDYNILVTDFGKTGQTPADIDGDGDVDIFDYNILVENFGKKA